MELLQISWLDGTLFVFMFGISAAIGVYYGCFTKQEKTPQEYLLGGRKLKIFPVAMSLIASTISGVTLLAMPSEIYYHGTHYVWAAVTPILVGIVMNFICLPIFWKLQISTAFEYLEIRFDKRVRSLVSFLFIVSNLAYLPIVIYAPSLAFNQITGFNLHIIAITMSSICVFYTTLGGLKAVVVTDTLQLLVTLSTLSTILIMGIKSAGGFTEIWNRAEIGDRLEFFNMSLDPTIRTSFFIIVIGFFFVWSSFIAVSPPTVQRFLSVPSLADAKKVLIIFIIGMVLTKTACCFSGLIIYAKYHDCDPLTIGFTKKADQILPFYVMDVAKQIPGLSGLFSAGLFSTALSTLSTFLNSISGVIYQDFVTPLIYGKATERRANMAIKLITVILGLVSVSLVFVIEKLGTIMELMGSFTSCTLGPLLGIFVMGIMFPFANSKGAMAGSLSTLIATLVYVFQHEIYMWNGSIKYEPKPLHTHGCNVSLATSSLLNYNYTTTMSVPQEGKDEISWVFRISIFLYVAFSTVLTVTIGLIISWFTATGHDKPVHPDTICPGLERLLKKFTSTTRYESVQKELNIIPVKEADETLSDKESKQIIQR